MWGDGCVINLMGGIFSQCIRTSDHHVVHFKYLTTAFFNDTSIKLKKKCRTNGSTFSQVEKGLFWPRGGNFCSSALLLTLTATPNKNCLTPQIFLMVKTPSARISHIAMFKHNQCFLFAHDWAAFYSIPFKNWALDGEQWIFLWVLLVSTGSRWMEIWMMLCLMG